MDEDLDLNDIAAVKKKIKELKQQEKWDEVREIQLKMFKRDPNNIRTISDLIMIADKNGDKKTVEKLIEKVLTLSPKGRKNLSRFIMSLTNCAKIAKKYRYNKLLKKIQTFRLTLQPNHQWSLCDLIVVAKKEEDWEMAEALQLRLLALKPEDEKALKSLEQIREKLEYDSRPELNEEDFLVEKTSSTSK